MSRLDILAALALSACVSTPADPCDLLCDKLVALGCYSNTSPALPEECPAHCAALGQKHVITSPIAQCISTLSDTAGCSAVASTCGLDPLRMVVNHD